MAQIVGYLTEGEARRFQEYAEACGVTASTLANLLISRELRVQHLPDLLRRETPGRGAASLAKVVAHVTDAQRKSDFYAHAATYKVKPAQAAAALYRAELDALWLLKAMRINQIDSD